MNDLSGEYWCTITNLFNSDTQEVNFQGNDMRLHYLIAIVSFSLANKQVLVYLSMEHLLLVVRCPLPAPLILAFSPSIGYTMDKLCPQQKVLKDS